jgi:hypothetical protein
MLPGMSEMRWRGAAAAVVAAVVVVLAGCGGGSGGDGKASASSSVSSEDPATEVPEDTEPAYPPGPEGEIDRKAGEEGWVVDSLYTSASEFVQDVCDLLPEQSKKWSAAQSLAEGGYLADDGEAILRFGMPKLCPKWSKTLDQAVSGDYDRWMTSGDYEVTAKPAPYDPDADSDVQQVKPGSYQAKGELSDCYWERTSQSGEIIANQFATQARVITVTLRAGELFHSEGCGSWRPLG